MVQGRPGWNFSEALQHLVDELPDVLARPLKVPVRSPKQAQRRLLPDEVAKLVAAYMGGDNMNVLAKRHQISRHTVVRWLHENAVELRSYGVAESDVPDVIRLYGEGWSLARLAQRYDCDPSTVQAVLRKAGIERRRPWERA